MHQEQRQRTHDLLQSRGIHQAIFANSSSVRWLTGFAPPVQLGPNFFLGGPPLVWYDDGHFTLILLDGQAGAAGDFASDPHCDIVPYVGYTIQEPIVGDVQIEKVLRPLLAGAARGKKIGIERMDLPVLTQQVVVEQTSTAEFTPIDHWLEPLRMVKTAEELTKLRANFALTDKAHAAARQAVAAGKREIDVWTEIHAAVEQAAGCRVALGNDCVVGYRQNNIGGWPEDLEIRDGDSLIVDLSTILDGYWSDSCATYYAGAPNADQIARHRMIERALDYAISLVKPGAVAREIDQKVRQFIGDAGYPVYPHHTGHGVGVTGHEGPRIVPYCEDVLEPGMVILLEPGTYVPSVTGCRLEDAMLVTADGAELLTTHNKSLP